MCGFVNGNKILNCPAPCILVGDDILSAHISEDPKIRLYHHIFNKMYCREIIGDLRFLQSLGEVKRDFLEDGVFNAKVLPHAKKLCRVSVSPYHYRIRENSFLHKERTIQENIGNLLNIYEIHSFMIESINRKSDLELAVQNFLGRVYLDIMTPYVEIVNLFAIMKTIAINNDLKIAIVVQNKSVEKIIFKLLLSENDYESMRRKIKENIEYK